ncbi:hypothetical protein M407DRAFT_73231 [Tulasnella calospora MUT 4182]|uniref:CxC2-like cysteine cluster KDZ transposase-associated domain-containing protein n=1 Tax=Tulasnella calospora MUT 4182 TaxID=1051891 RepID=A0A0C3QLC3_9AGAM|nr:hypothetical protein M407DRAFT_73231 [Tulasnella calospora MUT 4182]
MCLRTDSARLYQCTDCIHPPLICGSCTTDVHRRMPFHRLRFWAVDDAGNGSWEKTSLAAVGFVLHIGHGGLQCPRATWESVRTVQVLDINGQHSIPMLFCQCHELYEDQAEQLLQLRLYPASDDSPRTAFTFRVMKHFLLCQLEMCCSAASYYDMLALQTDSVNIRSLKNCYPQFLSSTREWKVIKTFMKANSKTGLDLKPGDATVKCGFCPIPGVNIPDAWKDDPEADLLYRVFEAFDGNFSLQLNNKGVTESVDPSIIGDAGYWVGLADGEQYLTALAESRFGASSGTNNTDSPCQHIRAGNVSLSAKAVNKISRGVVLGSCGRHNFSRPNAAMDLSLGEKYAGTCFLVINLTFSSLQVFKHGLLCYFSTQSCQGSQYCVSDI